MSVDEGFSGVNAEPDVTGKKKQKNIKQTSLFVSWSYEANAANACSVFPFLSFFLPPFRFSFLFSICFFPFFSFDHFFLLFSCFIPFLICLFPFFSTSAVFFFSFSFFSFMFSFSVFSSFLFPSFWKLLVSCIGAQGMWRLQQMRCYRRTKGSAALFLRHQRLISILYTAPTGSYFISCRY